MPLRYLDSPSAGALLQGEILADAVEHRVRYPAIVGSAREPVPVVPIPHPWVVVLNNVCDLQQDFDARAEQEQRGTEAGADAGPVAGAAGVETADREKEPGADAVPVAGEVDVETTDGEKEPATGAVPVAGEVDVETTGREKEPEEHQSLVRYVGLCCLISAEQVRRRNPSFKEKYLNRLRQYEILRYHYFPSAAVGEGQPLPEFFVDFQKAFAVPTQSLYDAVRAGGARRICVVPPVYMHDLIQRYHAFQSRVGLPV